jgi:hypothetical protein
VTEAEFEQLVTKLRPELIRIATRRAGRDQADDAVQKAVMQLWIARRWDSASTEEMTGRLRLRVKSEAGKELRGLKRLRDAQRNIRVLGDKGCRHVQSKPNSDGEVTNK